jgi:putative intracellular protease/amidase
MPLVTKAVYQERFAQAEANAKTIGILLYPGFEVLDVYGPVEMWGYVPEFKLVFVAEQAGPVKSTQGAETVAQYSFEDCPELDILMVPGGAGTMRELGNAKMLEFIRKQHEQADLTTSVCSGSAILAKAGVLDGHKATSNKQFFNLATAQSKDVDWVWEARWVDDGKVVTSSGVSAGMDMALHVIQRFYGEDAAVAIAEGTEYTWHREAADDPFARLIKRRE